MAPACPVILAIEDHRDTSRLIVDLLESEGFTVVPVASAGAALTQLRDGQVDLILTDLMLPDMSGLELCELVRADRRRYVPIIVYSAASGHCWKERSLAAGADDYLIKPFHIDDLLERVRSHLLAGVAAS